MNSNQVFLQNSIVTITECNSLDFCMITMFLGNFRMQIFFLLIYFFYFNIYVLVKVSFDFFYSLMTTFISFCDIFLYVEQNNFPVSCVSCISHITSSYRHRFFISRSTFTRKTNSFFLLLIFVQFIIKNHYTKILYPFFRNKFKVFILNRL